MADATPNEFTTLTVQLLSAFVSNNSVSSDGLAELIKSTRAALAESPASNTPEKPAPTFTPAVSVRKSLASADFILSLIDGKPYKTLKRHLTQHGLTPEQYRDRYKLPKSYPMVAPAYSEARRAVAEKLGLGKRPAAAAAKADESVARKAVSAVEAAVPGVATTSDKVAAEAGQGKASKAKSASSPAKKAAGGIPAKPEAKNPAAAAKASRKRLSIAAPKDAKPAPAAKAVAERQAGLGSVETTPAKTKGAPRKSAAADAVKPKASGKPKSLKSAMRAASAHLKAEGDSTEARRPNLEDRGGRAWRRPLSRGEVATAFGNGRPLAAIQPPKSDAKVRTVWLQQLATRMRRSPYGPWTAASTITSHSPTEKPFDINTAQARTHFVGGSRGAL